MSKKFTPPPVSWPNVGRVATPAQTSGGSSPSVQTKAAHTGGVNRPQQTVSRLQPPPPGHTAKPPVSYSGKTIPKGSFPAVQMKKQTGAKNWNPSGVIQKMEFNFGLNKSSIATGGATGVRPSFWPDTETYMYRGPGSARMSLRDLLGMDGGEQLDMEYTQCACCGLFYPQQALNVDHVVPWDTFKNQCSTRQQEIEYYNNVSNLQMLCTSCNLSKTSNPSWVYRGEYREGLSPEGGPHSREMRRMEAHRQSQQISYSLSGLTKSHHVFFKDSDDDV